MDASVLFDQLLLADLQETMAKLDNRVFAEMRSYIEPPELVLKIIQALLHILRPEGEYNDWKQCKKVKQKSEIVGLGTDFVMIFIYHTYRASLWLW